MSPRSPASGAARVGGHRSRKAAAGVQRVELTVPLEHVKLIKAVAKLLRGTDASNEHVLALQEIVGPAQRPARTGEELLAFFRSSPFVDEEIEFRRDASTGRSVDLS